MKCLSRTDPCKKRDITSYRKNPQVNHGKPTSFSGFKHAAVNWNSVKMRTLRWRGVWSHMHKTRRWLHRWNRNLGRQEESDTHKVGTGLRDWRAEHSSLDATHTIQIWTDLLDAKGCGDATIHDNPVIFWLPNIAHSQFVQLSLILLLPRLSSILTKGPWNFWDPKHQRKQCICWGKCKCVGLCLRHCTTLNTKNCCKKLSYRPFSWCERYLSALASRASLCKLWVHMVPIMDYQKHWLFGSLFTGWWFPIMGD